MLHFPTRLRVMTLLTTALVAGGSVAAATPAQALTWDHDRTNSLHFTVAGKRYLLSETAIGQGQTTIHVGQHTGTVWSRSRITVKDDHGRVLTRVDRHLYKAAALFAALGAGGFPSVKEFRLAEHRALAITAARAKAAYLKGLRLESIDADQETNVGQVIDYLNTLPADAKPDFNSIRVIHSDEYRGSVTVSGSDAEHWSVIVRDTQDGIGSFYDHATGSGTRFSI